MNKDKVTTWGTTMKSIHSQRSLGATLLVLLWIYGLVIAKGFWMTLFALLPFYAWYLAVQQLAVHYGLGV